MASPASLGFSWKGRQSTASRDIDNLSIVPGSPSAQSIRAHPQNITAVPVSTTPLHREPIRSFISGGARDTSAPVDSAEYARSVREDTAELASYFLSEGKTGQSPNFLTRPRSQCSSTRPEQPLQGALSDDEGDYEESHAADASDTILEVTEPPSPDEDYNGDDQNDGPSVLANMLRRSPPESYKDSSVAPIGSDQPLGRSASRDGNKLIFPRDEEIVSEVANEETPLIRSSSQRTRRTPSRRHNEHLRLDLDGNISDDTDIEGQFKNPEPRSWFARRVAHVRDFARANSSPRVWNGKSLLQAILVPVGCLPAVFVGLILNILDALSYGMILFPLGNPVFANLGPAGISMFYVSTIVSQVVFSTGSIFKGGVGSELIEVVPFFHSMAAKITSIVGEDNPDAVIATTIVSFCLSSILTGAVFFIMGQLKFGNLVGFIPRHILIGCIGGVGWFLVQTGFEVSARLEGSFHYDLETLGLMFRTNTLPLWTIPLLLAIVLYFMTISDKLKDNHYVLPVFICLEPAIFWFFVTALDSLSPEPLREKGWIFEAPPAGESWWSFYTLFKFNLIQWEAVGKCIPAMLALTFFGVLHVPINVPALALQTGEDHANLNRELKLHGLSNFLSGCAGSIQNYLVYANSQFFIKSGGDRRLAGYMLALFTGVVLVIGPVIIGFIPVMMVGTLIFVLGFELLVNALWDPRKKLSWFEYVTVVVIVLVMGTYDFVAGIAIGVGFATVSMIIKASGVSAIRATFSGEVVGSTVRRNPTQQHYLQKVGNQIYLIKLTGFLFFGTIVSVEEKIRQIIDDEEFQRRPIKFLILDLHHVTGLDYSAGEAFRTVSRLLFAKKIVLVVSGVEMEGPLGSEVRAVGLGTNSKDTEVSFCASLNSALESCENQLLRTFYESQEAIRASRQGNTSSLDVPGAKKTLTPDDLTEASSLASSPRRSRLYQAARESLNHKEVSRLSRWQNFKEPLRLMLQIFHDLSDKNEDFWMRAKDAFKRREIRQGETLFHAEEPATGFYLVESGILRAEYDLPQGLLYESIVAGTTCGELPFFSETNRTATVSAERACVLWEMDREGWDALQKRDPEVAGELLRIGLKLTSERMTSITSYVLTMAG